MFPKTAGYNKKLIFKKGMFECEKCEKLWAEGILRYRLQVRVIDVDGNAPFLLWDRECNQLLGMTTSKLKSLHPEVIFFKIS